MNKRYYFLAGFYRSGNTLLSSILNQNPLIYSSSISPLCEYIWQCSRAMKTYESSIINNYPNRSNNMISKMIENYYYDVEKPIILEREKGWLEPENVKIIKEFIDPNPKIIFTTRPIVEIIASLINIDYLGIVDSMNNSGYIFDNSISFNDNLCDFLMSDYAGLKRSFSVFESIDDLKNIGMFHIVKYEDLLDKPEETMSKIDEFLEIKSFNYNFTNIQRVEEYKEINAGLPEDLHTVRPILGRSKIKVEDYLSIRSIKKYKDLRYF